MKLEDSELERLQKQVQKEFKEVAVKTKKCREESAEIPWYISLFLKEINVKEFPKEFSERIIFILRSIKKPKAYKKIKVFLLNFNFTTQKQLLYLNLFTKQNQFRQLNSFPKIELHDLKIVTIMDDFSFNVFSPEAKFTQLTPLSWNKEIRNIKPDILFVESAWMGKNKLWKEKIRTLSKELIAILYHCRQNDIPTVFWNKEDPHHFDEFIETIKYFDFVFTTAIESIPKYKSRLGHENIFLLPFACQPILHNPIEKYNRKNITVFAGSYYPAYPKRMKVFELFIENLILVGGTDIYDRNFGDLASPYRFPKEYESFIKGKLEYKDINIAYKGYQYAMNLNTITKSKTMFARRVVELMASNTFVISNDSLAMKALFGDLLIATDSGDELLEKIGFLKRNPVYEKKLKLLALRKIMSEYTAENRLQFIVSKIYKDIVKRTLPQISIVIYVADNQEIENALSLFNRQSYDNKHIAIIYSQNLTNQIKYEIEGIQFISEKDKSTILEICKESSYIAGVNGSDYYGKNYLMDLGLATHYSSASVIGKGSYYVKDNTGTPVLKNSEAVYKKTDKVFRSSSIIKIEQVALKEIVIWSKMLSSAFYRSDDIFSIDEFNYCRNSELLELSKIDLELLEDLEDVDMGIRIDDII